MKNSKNFLATALVATVLGGMIYQSSAEQTAKAEETEAIEVKFDSMDEYPWIEFPAGNSATIIEGTPWSSADLVSHMMIADAKDGELVEYPSLEALMESGEAGFCVVTSEDISLVGTHKIGFFAQDSDGHGTVDCFTLTVLPKEVD